MVLTSASTCFMWLMRLVVDAQTSCIMSTLSSGSNTYQQKNHVSHVGLLLDDAFGHRPCIKSARAYTWRSASQHIRYPV